MARPVTLFTGQWANFELRELLPRLKEMGYDGAELCCWGGHFDPVKALEDPNYCKDLYKLLQDNDLDIFAISTHLDGQAVCDRIDKRHEAIVSPWVWDDGDPAGVNKRAAESVINAIRAAAKMSDAAGHKITVNGFTGSSIWHLFYSFPSTPPEMIEAGYDHFAQCWLPILDVCKECEIPYGLEVHPGEIAFDIVTTERALEAVNGHPYFGFNYDPSHLLWNMVDYLKFIEFYGDRIWHVHMKDARLSSTPTLAGILGGYTKFGDLHRGWDFCSLGRGDIKFDMVIRWLNQVDYKGPLSVEWEDPGMDQWEGAGEACAYAKHIDFTKSETPFDAAFEEV